MSERASLSEIASAALLDVGLKPRRGVLGANLTTIAVGGPLECLFEPEDAAQTAALVRALGSAGHPYRILGAGSNLLIDDRGCAECVIRLGRGLRGICPLGGGSFEIGGGAALMTAARTLSAEGFSGLEFAGGIPASLGGAVRMNAGAHGGQMADIVTEVTCVDAAGEIVSLRGSDLDFRYRHSSLPPGSLVIGVTVRLAPGDRAAIEHRRAELLARRKATQPLTLPSFGSVFKNPSGEKSAGALLEGVGLKGHRIGGAEISTLHANWIVNPGRTATANDVRALIGVCRTEVKGASGLDIEPEVVVW